MDIQALRNMRKTDFGKIAAEFDKISNPSAGGNSKSYQDDRFWKLEADKAGNASAVIRFLPRHPDDELPWVRIFNHAFQGPTGKWYIENSLTTIGEKDPVGELNSRLWNSGSDENKKIAQKQKRKLSYVANVLIISDPKHPENEGQVKLFKFGKKIFDKIMEKANPTFEDEKPVIVFDLWEGADFKLRMRKVDGFPNYDQSMFMEPAALYDGDEDALLKVVNSQHRLGEFTDPKNFKSFEELSRKLAMVLDGEASTAPSAASMSEDEDTDYTPPVRAAAPAPKPAAPKPTAPIVNDEDDDDVVSYFQKIANDA